MKRSRVLVVDDSALVRLVLSTVMAPHCAEVATAESVAEGKELLSGESSFHVLLSDMMLPDGNGFELLQYAHDLGQVPKIRSILMTANPIPEHAVRAKELGAHGYLAKPVSVGDIQEMLSRKQVDRKRKEDRSRLLGKAVLRDPTREDRPIVHWAIRDVSMTGAFLETTAPVPDGDILHLTLELGRVSIDAEATVVRAQNPSWANPGGVGVFFSELSKTARTKLRRFLTTVKGQDLPS